VQSGFTVELWDELRMQAQRHAESAKPLPLYAECVSWLREQVAKRKLEIAPSVIDFYAAELHSMVQQLREGLERRPI
jgi:hypothetical protein